MTRTPRTASGARAKRIPLPVLARWLRTASIIYLSAPVFIFLTGWLKFVLAWAVTALFLFGVASFIKACNKPADADTDEAQVSVAGMCAGILLATLPVVLSGAGGIGLQSWDWAKHNAILADLIKQPWPVVYQTGRDAVALVYYVAYYLPAALVGKLAGWTAANGVLFLTTWVGAVLAMLWLAVFARGAVIRAAVVLVLFSGMDPLGAMIVNPPAVWPEFIDAFHLEWWARHWQYSSNVSLLYFVPQQALAAWVATALVADAFLRDRGKLPVVLLTAALGLWSPFAVIGLLPVIGAYLLRSDPVPALREQLSLANLAGLAAGTVIVLYYLSRYVPYQLPDIYPKLPAGDRPGGFALLVDRIPWRDFVRDYAVFVLCEFLVLALVLLRLLRSAGSPRPLALVCVAAGILLLLPFFYYGIYNDLVMRAAVPALFVLQIGVALSIRPRAGWALRAVLIAVLGVGALYSANLLRMHVAGAYHTGGIVHIPDRGYVPTLLHIEMYPAIRLAWVAQYLGSTRSPFFRWLAPGLKPYPVGPPRNWQGPS